MTAPNPIPPDGSPRRDWAWRVFAAVVTVWMAFTFVTTVTEQLNKDRWAAAAFGLAGCAVTFYWAGIAFGSTARLRAARSRLTSPIASGPLSIARGIAVVVFILASFAAFAFMPEAYLGKELFAIIVFAFGLALYDALRRKSLSV